MLLVWCGTQLFCSLLFFLCYLKISPRLFFGSTNWTPLVPISLKGESTATFSHFSGEEEMESGGPVFLPFIKEMPSSKCVSFL
jgi:hypothetical protein